MLRWTLWLTLYEISPVQLFRQFQKMLQSALWYRCSHIRVYPLIFSIRSVLYHFVASMQLAKFCSSNDSEAKSHIVECFSPSGSVRLFQKRIKKTPQGEKLRGVKSIQPKGVGVPLCTQKVLYAMGFTLLEVTRLSVSSLFVNVTIFESLSMLKNDA